MDPIFSKIIFDLQNQLEKSLKQFLGKDLPPVELWDVIPIDTELLKAVKSFFFERYPKIKITA